MDAELELVGIVTMTDDYKIGADCVTAITEMVGGDYYLIEYSTGLPWHGIVRKFYVMVPRHNVASLEFIGGEQDVDTTPRP